MAGNELTSALTEITETGWTVRLAKVPYHAGRPWCAVLIAYGYTHGPEFTGTSLENAVESARSAVAGGLTPAMMRRRVT